MCESGNTESETSLLRIGNPLVIEWMSETKLSCVSMTPFGTPVVPEV